jgi:hypothetical protein
MIPDSPAALTRRTIRGDMAARGMRPAAELAADKPCGTRLRYYAGCRCFACRMANSAYEAGRKAARARGEGNGLVSAEPAREHLAHLSANGVGMKTAADSAKVAPSIVAKIVYRQRLKIREQTERRILAVTTTAAADGSLIDAGPTMVLVKELMASGYSKRRIGCELAGHPVNTLQLRNQITVRNAGLLRQIYDRLRLVTAAELRVAQRQLAELREECFRMYQIQREVDELAATRGWEPQTITPVPWKRNRWPQPARLTHRAAVLIGAVHARHFDINSMRHLETKLERENRELREENAALRRAMRSALA